MSKGITPYDFVQQVYYQQEKVILDFWPSDDKYKEVLMEANFVIDELNKEEDWTWLRETRGYGHARNTHSHDRFRVRLDDDVYKVSSRYGDCVRLYRVHPHHRPPEPAQGASVAKPDGVDGLDRQTPCHGYRIWPWMLEGRDYIRVPIVSAGAINRVELRQTGAFSDPNLASIPLECAVIGDELVFNRPFLPFEEGREIVVDVQRRMEKFHICNDSCKGVDPDSDISYEYADGTTEWANPCAVAQRQARQGMLIEVPDKNYVVIKTAALHAEGSPVAQGRVSTLTDNAQKLLSGMRQNDADATEPDYLDWNVTGFLNVI